MLYPSPTDLLAFMLKHCTDGADATFTVTVARDIDGVFDPTHLNSESNLDIQYAEAVSDLLQHQPQIFAHGRLVTRHSSDKSSAN